MLKKEVAELELKSSTYSVVRPKRVEESSLPESERSEIEAELECPVCLEISRPPIYQVSCDWLVDRWTPPTSMLTADWSVSRGPPGLLRLQAAAEGLLPVRHQVHGPAHQVLIYTFTYLQNLHIYISVWKMISGLTSSSRHLKLQYFAIY